MSGIKQITKERKEQLEKHGRSIADDVKWNSEGQLAEAALYLVQPKSFVSKEDEKAYHKSNVPKRWTIKAWTRMCMKPRKERLIIAGALLAAEIDRVEFIENQKKEK